MEIQVDYLDYNKQNRTEKVSTLEELGKICKVLQNAGTFYKIIMVDDKGYMTLATGPICTP